METYTNSRVEPVAGPGEASATLPAGLEALAAAVAELAGDDLGDLGDVSLAEQVVGVRRLLDQAEAGWLRLLAAADARGAGGAERGVAAPTAGWLRAGCRMSPAL
ncbi:MAG TPA: hypothetical protein VF486_11580, partial [Actinomycetes bacterium]